MAEQLIDSGVAVITGVTSGTEGATATGGMSIGEAMYRRLASRSDMTLIGLGRREPLLEALVAEAGGEYKVCDLADEGQIDEVAGELLEEYPAINLVVNNAGMPLRRRYGEAESTEVARVMKTNYEGPFRLTKALLPGLVEAAPAADVINIVSASAGIIDPNSGPYAASKAAQLSHSRSLTADLRPYEIGVHAILPGRADTPGHPKKPAADRSPISKIMARFTETDVDTIVETSLGRIGHRSGEVYVPRLLHGIAVLETIAPTTATRVVDALFS